MLRVYIRQPSRLGAESVAFSQVRHALRVDRLPCSWLILFRLQNAEAVLPQRRVTGILNAKKLH
jgi:hypothetical protein